MPEQTSATGRPNAQVQGQRYILPKDLAIERQGQSSAPLAEHYPEVRGGVCEFCGVLDHNVPSQHQYKLCPHFRGMMLRCSYCDQTKDTDEVAGKSILHSAKHPFTGELVVWCDSYECSKRHRERFEKAAS